MIALALSLARFLAASAAKKSSNGSFSRYILFAKVKKTESSCLAHIGTSGAGVALTFYTPSIPCTITITPRQTN